MKNEKFWRWLDGDYDLTERFDEGTQTPYPPRQEVKTQEKQVLRSVRGSSGEQRVEAAERKGFYTFYRIVAVVSCVFLISVLLYVVACLPHYGAENPRSMEVVRRYVEKGLEETGAVNIVSGMILDYRAFDTLGESHVLFTALICVTILLRRDSKNMRTKYEDYYTIRTQTYHSIKNDMIMRIIGCILLPSILLYGIYVLLGGQNGPGGGFSGGAVLGAGLIIFASSFGFTKADQVMTAKVQSWITFCALSFYSFAKGYVFFMGANGLDNHIPKGIPGAILSGGLILPLDIAVGMVVACTMYGFYSLFRRGSIGSA